MPGISFQIPWHPLVHLLRTRSHLLALFAITTLRLWRPFRFRTLKLASLFRDFVIHSYVLSIDLLASDGLYHTRARLYSGARTPTKQLRFLRAIHGCRRTCRSVSRTLFNLSPDLSVVLAGTCSVLLFVADRTLPSATFCFRFADLVHWHQSKSHSAISAHM